MADIAITAANVVKGSGAQTSVGTAGGTITAGQPLYINASGLLLPAIANVQLSAVVVGIALHGALANQPVVYQTAGQITIGGTVVAAKEYICSANAGAGGIAPISDVAAGWYTTLLGYAINTTVIQLNIVPSGISN